MADSEISVKIVADLEDIKRSLSDIARGTGKIKEVAGTDIDNVVGKLFVLKSGFDAVTSTTQAVAASLKAVTIDLAIMGEKAQQVENGFRTLAEGAGLSANSLKDAIENAAQGTIESTALLRRSGELITAFGKGAERIPELINLSRQAANAFGRDTEEVFNAISESVRNGNVRGLKQLGILIDTEKAVKQFAAANGVAANSLSESGRAQAILNAALEAGKRRFGEQKTVVESTTDAWARFKNKTEDAIEAVGQKTNEIFGGLIRGVLNNLSEGLGRFSDQLTGKLNVAVDESSSKIRVLTERMEMLKKQSESFVDQTSAGAVLNRDEEIKKVEKQIEREEELLNQQSKAAKMRAAAEANAPAVAGTSSEKENEIKFQSEIQAIRMQNAEAMVKSSTDVATLEEAQFIRRVELENQLAAKKAEVANNDIFTAEQKNAMLYELEVQHKLRLQELELAAEQERMNALQRQLEMTSAVDEQVALSAEMQARRTSDAWRKSGGLGGAAVNSFSNQAMNAFQKIGSGAATVSEALRGAFFGMLGDVATAQGKTMFLTNLAPPLGPNPAGMAAGLGLIALGGLLGAMGSGGKAGAMGAGGGGAGGIGPEGGFGGPTVGDATKDRRREVTINVEGNYFESEQTRLAIVEAVRSASDANDFTVQRGNRR